MKCISMKLVIFLFLLTTSTAVSQIRTTKESTKILTRLTPELEENFSAQGLNFGDPIFIRIFKESHEFELWVKKDSLFELYKIYKIASWGSGRLGPKIKSGDGQAPEGFYFVTPSQLKPDSDFHLAFNIGYPNLYDRIHDRTGSFIMVHGSTVSIGCFAMTDEKIEEIYTIASAALSNTQSFFRIHIFPFRMTDENMELHSDSNWYSFWENLKEGYDYFEDHRNPPNVEVRRGRYVFEAASN